MRRRKKPRQKHFRPVKPKLFLITNQNLLWPLLFILTLGSLVFIYYSGFFKIKAVLCLDNNRPCDDNISAELATLVGSNILTFRSDQLESKLMQADVSVDQVNVSVKLPSTIKVQLRPRQANLSIATATNSSLLLIDSNFTPFKVVPNSNIKAQIISARAEKLNLGEQINDPIIRAAIQLARVLKDNFISFQVILPLDDRLQLVLSDSQQAWFPIDENFQKNVTSLQFILRKTTIQPQPKIIDLRFNKPVLRL